LRAGKVSATAIAETMSLMNKAVGVLNGAAAAGKSVASDLMSATNRVVDAATSAANSVRTPTGETPVGTSGTTGASGGATTGAAGNGPSSGSGSGEGFNPT
jgi:hypothetical protein